MWEVISVLKRDVKEYLEKGWEPLNGSMVNGHNFNGSPVTREYWHLRRWKVDGLDEANPSENRGS